MLVMGGVEVEEPHVRRGTRVLASVAYFNVMSQALKVMPVVALGL